MNSLERARMIADAIPDKELRERFTRLLVDHDMLHRELDALSKLNCELDAKVNNQYADAVAERETRKAEGRAAAAEQAAEDLARLLPLLQEIPYDTIARYVHLANRHAAQRGNK